MGFWTSIATGVGGFFAGLALGGSKPTSLAEAIGDISQNINQDESAACSASQVTDIKGLSISIGNIDCEGDVNIGTFSGRQNVSCKINQTQSATAQASIDASAESKNGADFLTGGNSTAISEADLQQNIQQRLQSTCSANQETRLSNWSLNLQNVKSHGGACNIVTLNQNQQMSCVIDQAQTASEQGNLKLTAKSTVTGTSGWSIMMVVGIILVAVLLIMWGRKGFARHAGVGSHGPLRSLGLMTKTYQRVVDTHPAAYNAKTLAATRPKSMNMVPAEVPKAAPQAPQAHAPQASQAPQAPHLPSQHSSITHAKTATVPHSPHSARVANALSKPVPAPVTRTLFPTSTTSTSHASKSQYKSGFEGGFLFQDLAASTGNLQDMYA